MAGNWTCTWAMHMTAWYKQLMWGAATCKGTKRPKVAATLLMVLLGSKVGPQMARTMAVRTLSQILTGTQAPSGWRICIWAQAKVSLMSCWGKARVLSSWLIVCLARSVPNFIGKAGWASMEDPKYRVHWTLGNAANVEQGRRDWRRGHTASRTLVCTLTLNPKAWSKGWVLCRTLSKTKGSGSNSPRSSR